jgi:hypothetical protein
MNPDTIHEVDAALVRKIEDLLSRPSIPVGRQLIDQTFNKKRDKQMADDLSTAMLYLLYTNKVKREQAEDGIPKFWLASRETPTDANGREITLVGGLSRQFHYRLISGDKCIETNVVGVGDSVVKRAPPVTKTMFPVPQDKATQDQLAAVMLQNGTPEQVKEAVAHVARPTIIEEMRAAAAAVDSEDEDDTPPNGPPVVEDAANFFHARLKQLEGYRLDDQLVIAVGFWAKPVAESELLEFMVRHGFGKSGTIKMRLAHVVNVRQELTRTEEVDGFYYSVGPKSANLKPRPKTAPYKPKMQPQETARTVSELVQPTVSVVSKPTEHPLVEPVDNAKPIELTESSKVMYLVDSNGGLTINVNGTNVLCFNPGAAAKLVNFTSNVKGLYDL